MLKTAIPVIHVSNSVQAEEFYCAGLGFRVVGCWRPSGVTEDPCYLTLEREKVRLHVTSFKDGTVGTWTSNVYIFVEDVDTLYAELLSSGSAKPSAPVDQTWGKREIGVRDADRNVITFGQRIASASTQS